MEITGQLYPQEKNPWLPAHMKGCAGLIKAMLFNYLHNEHSILGQKTQTRDM